MSAKAKTPDWYPEELSAARPPEQITVSQWAERNRVLGRHAAIKGPYSLEMVPFLVPIMDACNNPDIDEVVCCKSAQIGGTDGLLCNPIGYYCDQEPSSIMIILADQETAQYVGAEKIEPMFTDSPALLKHYDPKTFNREEIKTRNGGYISIAWASSVAKLGSKPIRIVICDEIDKPGYYAASKEASALSLCRERTNTFPEGYRKHIFFSTPTDETGNVTVELFSCDVIFDWHIPCPSCGQFQPLRWSPDALYTYGFQGGKYRGDDGMMYKLGGVVWEGGRHATREQISETARYQCGSCGYLIDDIEKNEAVRRGKMVPRTETTGQERKIGFHINRLYSLFDGGKLANLVQSWVNVQKYVGETKQKQIQGFINSSLAEPWKQVIIKAESSKILSARCDLPPMVVPDEAVALFCGIDVQKSGFWFAVRAFSRDYTGWLIDYGFLPTWDDVENKLFNTAYPSRDGSATHRIWRAALDTGGGAKDEGELSMTEETYWWIIKNVRRGVNIWGTKGSSRPIPGRFKPGEDLISSPSGKRLPPRFRIILIDTETMKDTYHAGIERAVSGEAMTGEGTFYLHNETGEDYSAQILAEEKRIDARKHVAEWVRVKKDNHLLDAEVLAISLAHPQWIGGGVNLVAPPAQQANQNNGQQQQQTRTGMRVLSKGVEV